MPGAETNQKNTRIRRRGEEGRLLIQKPHGREPLASEGVALVFSGVYGSILALETLK